MNKKLRVCDVCGSFLSIMDSDKYVHVRTYTEERLIEIFLFLFSILLNFAIFHCFPTFTLFIF